MIEDFSIVCNRATVSARPSERMRDVVIRDAVGKEPFRSDEPTTFP